ncbi:hypothetical protein DIPPA_29554 [Diplonema papillatum]|nr:hypothetical protein DIPPA_29554 [Diplonema papillatum]
MNESAKLFPREIAVLRAVQGSFRQLRQSRRPVDGLVLQVAGRLDQVGERAPGYWRADAGRRVRAWLLSPSGLPAYPRIRAKSTSPPRYPAAAAAAAAAAAPGTTTAAAAAHPQPPAKEAPAFSAQQPCAPPAAAPPGAAAAAQHQLIPAAASHQQPVSKFRRMPQGDHSQPAHQPSKPPPGISEAVSRLMGDSVEATAPGQLQEGANNNNNSEEEAVDVGSSPSSIVAASWQLYDEALRRFTEACNESEVIIHSAAKPESKQFQHLGATSGELTVGSVPPQQQQQQRSSPRHAFASSMPLSASAHNALRIVEEARAVIKNTGVSPISTTTTTTTTTTMVARPV